MFITDSYAGLKSEFFQGYCSFVEECTSDGRTETIDSNIFKSSQSRALFLNPANQMSATKQNLNLFVVLLTRLQCCLYAVHSLR